MARKIKSGLRVELPSNQVAVVKDDGTILEASLDGIIDYACVFVACLDDKINKIKSYKNVKNKDEVIKKLEAVKDLFLKGNDCASFDILRNLSYENNRLRREISIMHSIFIMIYKYGHQWNGFEKTDRLSDRIISLIRDLDVIFQVHPFMNRKQGEEATDKDVDDLIDVFVENEESFLEDYEEELRLRDSLNERRDLIKERLTAYFQAPIILGSHGSKRE